MPKSTIYIARKRAGMHRCKPIVAYEGDKFIARYESIVHAATATKHTRSSISRHLQSGEPIDGVTFYFLGKDPYSSRVQKAPDIYPAEDLPVVSFFKDDDQPITRFKSVSFLAQCLNRPVSKVLGWLKGARCTDPDCYYKYENDCTKKELNLLERTQGKI